MTLLQRFQQHWQHQFPHFLPQNCHLLVAVSGGIDSVVLTHLLQQCGFKATIAHCNFGLRGAESERDEAFVRNLAFNCNFPIEVIRFNTENYAKENKISIQEAARKLRYQWFSQLNQTLASLNKTTIHLIATAHHADDNIETVCMQFFRGTGIEGLRGIMPLQKEQQLIRPLLPFRKLELLTYAEDNNLAYVEDSSNASDKYTRNFFRNQLLPNIKNVYPSVEENLLNNINRMTDVATLYQQAVAFQLKKLLEYKQNETHIPILKLKACDALPTIAWEMVKPYQFTANQVPEIIKLLDANNGSYIASKTHRIIKNRKWLIIATLQTEEAKHILVEKTDKKIVFQEGELQFEIVKQQMHSGISNAANIALIDVANICYPLLLRKWKTGDYFYPLGMQKKKKLSKFFIDKKLSKTEKEKIWVIESNKKIVWVIGLRIDDRVKISGTTSHFLQINYLK